MRRVALIGTRGFPSYYGGFETLLRHLVPHLADKGWEVDVYNRRGCTVPDYPLSTDTKTHIHAFETPCVERQSFSTLTHGLTSTTHATLRRRPDVALVMNVANGYWLPALRATGIPSVVNVDGIEWERAKWGSTAKTVFRAGAGLTARFADEIVVDSTALAERWRIDFGREGHYIPYGASGEGAGPLPTGLTAGGYALFVGRLVPENTVGEFIAAADVIARTRDVVIVGSSGYGGPLEDAVRELEARHTRVRWMGHIRDDATLFSLWQNAGAYFHGHSVGGTNPALVQAMALGAPTIARDTVYNREVLRDSALFVPADHAAIAAAMITLLDDQAAQDRIRSAVRERQRRTYLWEDVCDAYADLLSDVTEARAPRVRRSHRRTRA